MQRRKCKLPVIQFGYFGEYDCGRDGENGLKGGKFEDRKNGWKAFILAQERWNKNLTVTVRSRGGLKWYLRDWMNDL